MFQTPITINEAVNHIHRKKYLLPSIQRELVWTTEQIEKLFDSLMRGYPIGSFLFWFDEKQRSKNYQFYEVMRIYHEKDSRHNEKANISGEDDITAVLDGQQRLTSLYIGLKGSYSSKLPRKRWDNNAASAAARSAKGSEPAPDMPEGSVRYAARVTGAPAPATALREVPKSVGRPKRLS